MTLTEEQREAIRAVSDLAELEYLRSLRSVVDEMFADEDE